MKPANRWIVAWVCLFTALVATAAQAGPNTWTATGLYGGPSYAVAVDPKHPTTLYEANPGGGVFKSTDGGMTWASANVGLTDLGCQSIVIDPANPDVLYTSGQISFYKSTDGAASWTAVGSVYDGRQYVIDPTTPSTIYGPSAPYGAATVVKSLDSGHTWTSASSSSGLTDYDLRALTMDPESPQTLYAAADSGVFKTVNGGQTWTLLASGLGDSPYVNAVAVDPLDGKILYAVSDSSQGIFKSGDGGHTWAASGVIAVEDDPTLVAVDPVRPNFVYLVAGGPYVGNVFYVSSDAGAHWTAANTGLPPNFGINLRSISTTASAPVTLYLGTDFGVYASANRGQQWTRRVTGLTNMNVNTVAVDPVTPTTLYAGTAYSGMFKSVDNGFSWAPINKGLAGDFVGNYLYGVSSIAINPRNTSELFIGTGGNAAGQPSGVFKSLDAGATWQASVGGALSDRPYVINDLAIDPNHPKTLLAVDGRGFGVAQSNDAGVTWSWVNQGLPIGLSLEKVVITTNSIAVASINPLSLDFTVYVSPYTSGSATAPTWTALSASNALTFIDSYLGKNASIMELATVLADLQNPSLLNLGGSSNTSFNPAPCKPFTGLFLDPYAKKNVYLTGQCGVVLVSDLGATVAKLHTGLPAGTTVNGMATAPSGKVLFAATAGGGVYKYTISP